MGYALNAAVANFVRKRNNPKVAVAGLYPPTAPEHAPGDVVAPDGSVTTSRKSPRQVADQAAFDQKMGFTDSAARTNFANAAETDRAARLKKDPYDIGPYAEDTTGTFGSQRAPEIVGGANGAPAFQRTANGAVSEVPKAIPVSPVNRTDGLTPTPTQPGALAGPLAAVTGYKESNPGAYQAVGQYNYSEPTAAPAPTGTPAAVAAALPSAPAATPGSVALSANPPVPVSPTPEGAGRSTAAGVSNAQAAGFQQPTQANPVPVTPTSPVLDANDFDKRPGNKFAGF